MAIDPFSDLLGAIIGRAIGAAGVQGGVSLGHTLGRAISRASGVAGNSQGGSGAGDDGNSRIPDEVKSLLKQPLQILMPNLPNTAYQPLLQGSLYRATNERGEAVGEGFKNVMDAISKMDEMITAHRARFISERTGVPLMVNAAGEIVRGAAGAGGDGASSSGGISNLSGLVSMLVRGGVGRGAAAGAAGAAGGAGAAGAGGAGSAGAGAAAGLLNPATAALVAVGAVGVAAAAAPFAIRNWTENLLQSQEGLRRFNGEINMAFAESNRRDLLRSKEHANATSTSTGVLAAAVSDLKDEFRPLSDLATNVANYGGAVLAKLAQIEVSLITQSTHLDKINAVIEWFEQKFKGDVAGPKTHLEFLTAIADGRYSGYDRTRTRRLKKLP